MEEVKWILVVGYLLWLAVCDMRKLRVSMVSLAAGMIGTMVIVIIECSTGQRGIVEVVLGVLPSIFLLVLAWLTQKVGYADGTVLLMIGMLYGYGVTVFILCMSVMMLALVSGILLILRKAGRNTLIPYIPFLAVTFVLHGIVFS